MQLLGNYQRCSDLASSGQSGDCMAGWGSQHAAGVINFAWCDGSVSPVAPSIIIGTFNLLTRVADDQLVDPKQI